MTISLNGRLRKPPSDRIGQASRITYLGAFGNRGWRLFWHGLHARELTIIITRQADRPLGR
jgi:hypothetical protein